MHKYVKPNGKEVTINDGSVKYAESIGWKKKEDEKEPEKSKKDK